MERFLAEGTLIDLLDSLMHVEDPSDGLYMLYTPRQTVTLEQETACFVLLFLHDDEDDFVPSIAVEKGMEAALEVDMIKRIIRKAYSDRPELSKENIIKAINYYLDNDAFLSF